jgi:hypothetical protein
VAKLRAAREEADAKQAQMQKEIKEEMERLRTQYTFKVCSATLARHKKHDLTKSAAT